MASDTSPAVDPSSEKVLNLAIPKESKHCRRAVVREKVICKKCRSLFHPGCGKAANKSSECQHEAEEEKVASLENQLKTAKKTEVNKPNISNNITNIPASSNNTTNTKMALPLNYAENVKKTLKKAIPLTVQLPITHTPVAKQTPETVMPVPADKNITKNISNDDFTTKTYKNARKNTGIIGKNRLHTDNRQRETSPKLGIPLVTPQLSFNLFYHNMQCLRTKVNELEAYIGEKFNMLCMNETWLTETETEYLKIGNFRTAYQFSRKVRAHGGVEMLDNTLSYEKLEDLNSLSIEQHCKISAVLIPVFNLTVITVYRSPNPKGTFVIFMEIIEKVCNKVNFKMGNVLIVGDFNVCFKNVNRQDDDDDA
ncbi:unnamed protein product [Brassicogethes aeneus]|uniref:Endonuclease/exonuclease/phosphatase domain-containing protein n=1 Tax=Brassicogethes aeneus TaxID=1431903 RepID=A0A9P0ASC4_BRAAE|nr:unnamed protein product [Brassicogethes aeneus]